VIQRERRLYGFVEIQVDGDDPIATLPQQMDENVRTRNLLVAALFQMPLRVCRLVFDDSVFANGMEGDCRGEIGLDIHCRCRFKRPPMEPRLSRFFLNFVGAALE
jgi:hypothetical protein